MIPDELKKYNAIEIEDGKGYIPVVSRITEPKILEYKIIETTPVLRKFKQERVQKFVDSKIKSQRIIFEQGLFRKMCTKYIDPKIIFQLFPYKLRNVTLHWWGLYFEGDIVNRFINKGEDGQKGTAVQWRWRACPSDYSSYSWEVIEDSADILSNWIHKLTEDNTGETLIGKLSQSITNKLPNGRYVDISAHWKTDEWSSSIFWQVVRYLTTGTLSTTSGFDVTVKYNWLGKTVTKSYHVNARIALPVEGNINWDW